MRRYARQTAAIYRAEMMAVIEAFAESAADMEPRADASIKRGGQITISAGMAQALREALRQAARNAARKAARVPQPVGAYRGAIETASKQAARAERAMLIGLGASPSLLAIQLKVPRDRLLGIDIAPSLAEQRALEQIAREGIDLIESIPADQLERFERWIAGSVREGVRHESIALDIERRMGVEERHARLIARDQINKVNGAIEQATQTEAGIDRYIWRATSDGAVRPSHEEVDGIVFLWSDPPPGTGPYDQPAHPGEAIQCRCTAEPVIPASLRGGLGVVVPMPQPGDRIDIDEPLAWAA